MYDAQLHYIVTELQKNSKPYYTATNLLVTHVPCDILFQFLCADNDYLWPHLWQNDRTHKSMKTKNNFVHHKLNTDR
jgi:hypothetical protein